MVLLLVLVTFFGAIGFMAFNRDMSRTVGTSVITNAVLYRKMRDDAALTRLRIIEIRESGHRTRREFAQRRSEKLQLKESALADALKGNAQIIS